MHSPASSTPSPCFLVGAERSGTTWVQRLLQSHPDICGGEESHFFTLFGAAHKKALAWGTREKRPIGPLTYMDADAFDDLLRIAWRRMFSDLYADNPAAHVHLEKTPGHSLYLDEITRLFPKAKIIHLVRDSRAVAASQLHASAQPWGRDWAASTAYEAATRWYSFNNAILRWRKRAPDHPYLRIRYEDMLQDPQAILTTLLDFVSPANTSVTAEEMVAGFQTRETKNKDPADFSRKRGRDGWKNDLSAWQKLVVWRYTRKRMRAFGYEIGPFW